MNHQTNEYREMIAASFVELLEQDNLDWKKEWNGLSEAPMNASTNCKYKGINRFYLGMLQIDLGIEDPRWATFKQIQDKGWKLKKGAKGAKVEYWSPYDYEKKKLITWQEYYKRVSNKEEKEPVGIISKYFSVFNAKDIEGIPPIEKQQNKEVVSDKLIEKLVRGMNVILKNDGGDRAFYKPSDDTVHLPQKESFNSTYAYNSTALHELTHASGSERRLNRNISNMFGTAEYAYEELVAEIGSSFMGEFLQIDVTDEHIINHAAYVKNWISCIKEKPGILFQAIKDAEKAANYLEYKAELVSEKDYKKLQESTIEVKETQILDEVKVNENEHSLNNTQKQVINEVKKAGFQPNRRLVSNIQKLNRITGKSNSLAEIRKKQESNSLSYKESNVINEIASDCKRQELSRCKIR